MTRTTAHLNAKPDQIAQRLYDELHAPNGRVPTLDDYTPILRELRHRDEPELVIAVPPPPPPPPARPPITLRQHMDALRAGYNPFLHHDRDAGIWIVSHDRFPLDGFTMMRAPDGQYGFVFQSFIDYALDCGAVVAEEHS